MTRITKALISMLSLPLMVTATVVSAQTPGQRESLSVQGCSGQATVIRAEGRMLVDIGELAAITNGSITFKGGDMVLTMPGCADSQRAEADGGKALLSRPFMRTAIEAMASIREWGGILQATVQDRYPVANAMTGNTIIAYESRAADAVGLAAASASTDSDYRGLELLQNEFNNVKAWTDKFLRARKSLTAQYMTLSDSPFQDDEQAQKIMQCGQFLEQMFPSGSFRDDAACH